MTVTSTTNRASWSGSAGASTGPFTFDFRTTAVKSHIQVTRVLADGTSTILNEGPDYTLTLVRQGRGGGRITLATGLTSGQELIARRLLPYEQATALRNQGAFFLETVEDMFDYSMMCLQQGVEQTLGLTEEGDAWDGSNIRIVNVADPESGSDAATATWVNQRITDTLELISAGDLQVGFGDTIVMSSLGFGPDSTITDNTTAFSSALDDINSRGGGRIVFDLAGVSQMNTVQKTGIDNLTLEFVPGATLYGPNVDYLNDRGLIELYGTTTSTTTLTSAGVLGSTTIVVADGSKLSLGQMIQLQSSGEYFNGISGVSGYQPVEKFELNWVIGISGNNITLAYPLASDYSVSGYTVTVTPISKASNVTIEGKALIKGPGLQFQSGDPGYSAGGFIPSGSTGGYGSNGSGSTGIHFKFYEKVTVRDIMGLGWNNAFVRYQRCWNVRVRDSDVIGLEEGMPTQQFYGHLPEGSYLVDFGYINGKFCRRPVDSGTSFITRHYTQHHIDADTCNGSGFGSHHSEHYDFHDNRARNCPIGATLRGVNGKAHHNEIIDCWTGYNIGSGDGNTTNTATAGTVLLEGNRIKVSSGTGIYSKVNLDRFKSVGDVITGATDHAYRFRGCDRRNVEISQHTIEFAAGTASGKHAIYFENASNSNTVQDGINIGDAVSIKGCTGSLVEIESATSASVTNNISVGYQRSNGTEARKTNLTIKGSGSFGSAVNIWSDSGAGGAHGGFRNRVANGDFKASSLAGWKMQLDSSAVVAQSRTTSSLPPSGSGPGFFSHALLLNVTTTALPSAGHLNTLQYAMSGQDIYDLAWGGSSAKAATLGFWVRATVAGIYGGSIQNADKSRSYPFTFTVNTGFVWEFKTINIVGDASGTWSTTSDPALLINFDLGSGTDFNGTANAWASANKTRTSDVRTYINGSTSDQLRITGVWFGPGSVAPEFEYTPQSVVLQQQSISLETKIARLSDNFVGGTLSSQWATQVGSDAQCVAAAHLSTGKSGIVRLTAGDDATGTMAVNGSLMYGTGRNWYANAGGLVFEAKVLMSSVSSVAAFIGLSDQNSALEMPIDYTGATLVTTATDAVGFVFDTAGGDSSSQIHMAGVANDVDATAQTHKAGLSISVWRTLRIEIDTSGNAVFRVDGVQAGKVMAGAVTPTVALAPTFAIFSRTTATKSLDVDWVVVQANTN